MPKIPCQACHIYHVFIVVTKFQVWWGAWCKRCLQDRAWEGLNKTQHFYNDLWLSAFRNLVTWAFSLQRVDKSPSTAFQQVFSYWNKKSFFETLNKGWDKTFCLQYVAEGGHEEIHFFGDKTLPGGNDHEIFEDSRTVGLIYKILFCAFMPFNQNPSF